MTVRLAPTNWSSLVALPWRAVNQRYTFAFFVLLSMGLLVIGRVQPALLENARAELTDHLAPVLDMASFPLRAAEDMHSRMSSYLNLQKEVERLRTSNAQLVQWQNAVITLQNENRELRNLLHFKNEPNLSYVSARVIADAGGPFVRTLIVTAGKQDGVREGMAAMAGEGLIGRVVEVGDWSSRILLITDLNSRIPVTIADSGDRAILAGDNSPQPKLLYLSQDAIVTSGARIITSGHGGIFPPGLPVGAVVNLPRGGYTVVPAADFGRVNDVKLIDFNLKGGSLNSFERKIEKEQRTR
jgi:rod shape-determining protein MreC